MSKNTTNIRTSDSTGIPITMGGAQELDLTASAGEIIDPKTVAAAISEDTTVSDETLTGVAEIENEDTAIIDETKGDEDEVSVEDEIVVDTTKKDKKENVEEESAEVETFKVLAKHFRDEGILEGYTEEMENTSDAFQDMVTQTVDKGIQDYKDSFANPLSKQFLEYIENDGDPGQFMQLVSGPNYSQVTEEALQGNEAIQKQILRAYYSDQGDSTEDTEETIQAFENAGNLDKRAKVALNKLQKKQTSQLDAEMKQQQLAKSAQTEQINKYIKTLETDINGREEIGGFPLTKKTRADFFDYITKVNPKTGATGLHTDSQDQEKQLLMSFYYYNNFKFDKLAKKVKSNTTQTLMDKLGRHTDVSRKQTSRKQTPVSKEEGSANLTAMKNLFG